MDETKLADYSHFARISNMDAVSAMHSFRQRQQRRPSNLLQCMDQNGNIDAFRYIEYSKQRRMEFLNRAKFICTMKSTIQQRHHHQHQQQQQQQQHQRSDSLPGSTATMHRMFAVPSAIPSALTKLNMDIAAVGAGPNTYANAPAGPIPNSSFSSATNINRGMVYWKALDGAADRRNCSSNNNRERMSLPLLSYFAMKNENNTTNMNMNMNMNMNIKTDRSNPTIIKRNDAVISSNIGKRNTDQRNNENNKSNNINSAVTSSHTPEVVSSSSSEAEKQQQHELHSQPHRRLEKEEIEAAEALLFGMGRRCSNSNESTVNAAATSVKSALAIVRDRRNDRSSSEDEHRIGGNTTTAQHHYCDGSNARPELSRARKRKVMDHHGLGMTTTTFATRDDVEPSVIVRAEEVNSSDNYGNNNRRKHLRRD
mmetsp:Transcript_19411/g.39949  ORF Transcript_19411/g.39949 Transcript_19411/m.39949 type:complete len:425 (-) Transcript_19411:362-1636(-)